MGAVNSWGVLGARCLIPGGFRLRAIKFWMFAVNSWRILDAC